MIDYNEFTIDNNNKVKEYIIKRNNDKHNEYLMSSSIYDNFVIDNIIWVEDINKSLIFELTLNDMNKIVSNLSDNYNYEIIEIDRSTTIWSDSKGNTGQNISVYPKSKDICIN